jgi:predicted HTH transcriptional regulator
MSFQGLSTLVRVGESDHVEFKQTTRLLDAGVKTVYGMLNGLSGFILFGVADNGRIIGQDISTHTLEEIAERLHRIEPPALPDKVRSPIANRRADWQRCVRRAGAA